MTDPIVPPDVLNAGISPDTSGLATTQNATSVPVDLQPVVVIAQKLQQNNPESRIEVSKLINNKVEADKSNQSVNTHTQWAPFILSLIGGNSKEAYKYWNGGATRLEEAYTPTLGRVMKEYNWNGATNKYFDVNNNPLNAEQIAQIDSKGGAISKFDSTAAQTAGFQNAGQAYQETMTGLRKPILDQYSRAASVSTAASSLNGLLDERIKLAKTGNWMNIISGLPPEKRQELFTTAQQYATQSKGATTGEAESKGASATIGTTENLGNTVNVAAEISGKGAGIVPPGGAGGAGGAGGISGNTGISGSVGGSSGTGAQNQSGATAGAQSTSGATAGTSTQLQSALRNKIEGIIQGKIGDQDFNNIQRYLQLTSTIDELQSAAKLEQNVPGAVAVTKVDPYLTGSKNSMVTDLNSQRNVALASAWESYFAKKLHESGGNINANTLDQIKQDFLATNTAKGIAYRFDNNIKEIRSNTAHKPAEGDVSINNSNRPMVFKNGQWEKLNGR